MPQEPNEPQSTSQNPESPAGQSAQQGSASQNPQQPAGSAQSSGCTDAGYYSNQTGIRLQIINQILPNGYSTGSNGGNASGAGNVPGSGYSAGAGNASASFTGDTERPMGPMEGFLLLPVLLMRLWAIALKLRDGVPLHPPLRWARLLSSHLNRMDGLLESWWLWRFAWLPCLVCGPVLMRFRLRVQMWDPMRICLLRHDCDYQY